jgi:hypothetical protein
VRQPFPGNVIPQERLSPQALNILSLIPKPNADGRDNGTRENYVASGSEIFDGDAFNVRMDGAPRKRTVRPLQLPHLPATLTAFGEVADHSCRLGGNVGGDEPELRAGSRRGCALALVDVRFDSSVTR